MEGKGQHVDGVVEPKELQKLDCLECIATGQAENDELVGQVDVLKLDISVAFGLDEIARDLSGLFNPLEEHLEGYA